MSVRLRVAVDTVAPAPVVWRELTDWAGQARWIPLTDVRVVSDHAAGLGVRAEALSGFRLGPVPVGLLDRFVVTGWTPPGDGAAELEVLHLGPYFTGEGVFRLEDHDGGTRIVCTELFSVPGGGLVEGMASLALPVMRAGLTFSLRRLAAVCEGR